MYSLINFLHYLIHTYDPSHLGALFADAFTLGVEAVVLLLVIRLYRRVKELDKRAKEHHPDDV